MVISLSVRNPDYLPHPGLWYSKYIHLSIIFSLPGYNINEIDRKLCFFDIEKKKEKQTIHRSNLVNTIYKQLELGLSI